MSLPQPLLLMHIIATSIAPALKILTQRKVADSVILAARRAGRRAVSYADIKRLDTHGE